MKKNLFFLLCMCCLFLNANCSSENEPEEILGRNEPEEVSEENEPEENPGDEELANFYAAPFNKVPETADIIMYQVNPRVFAEKNSLQEVTKQLERIKELSVNVIWLMPINELGKEKSVNSPYCIKDYKKLDPEFGTLEELRTLVSKAHELGMAVIMDWVANHTSWDHAWINTNKDWYTQDENGNIQTPNSSWKDVADLNFERLALHKAMVDAMKYWICEANIDGYRCDAADRIPVSFWNEANRVLKNLQSGRTVIMLAEGTRVGNFAAGFDMDYGWDYLKKIKDVYSNNGPVSSLFSSHENEYKSLVSGKRKLRFITNHDEATEHIPGVLYGSQAGATSAFVVTACIGGNPLIYSSQEIGYDKLISFFKYVEMDWDSNPGIFEEYKNILNVFSGNKALMKGELQSYSSNDVASFYKLYEWQEAFVLVNTRNSNQTISIDKQITGQWKNAFTGETFQMPESIELTPYEYRIYEK